MPNIKIRKSLGEGVGELKGEPFQIVLFVILGQDKKGCPENVDIW